MIIPQNFRIKLLALSLICQPSSLLAKIASCGPAPNTTIIDTIENNSIVYEIERGQNNWVRDTSHFSELRMAIETVIKMNKHVSIASVIGTCDSARFAPICIPMVCNFKIKVDSIVKGDFDTSSFQHYVQSGCGYDNPNWYLEGKRFLLFSEKLPHSRVTVEGPCYNFPKGFFIENGYLYNFEYFGQRFPISNLKPYPVSTLINPTHNTFKYNSIPFDILGRTINPMNLHHINPLYYLRRSTLDKIYQQN